MSNQTRKEVMGCQVSETTLDENPAILTYQENVCYRVFLERSFPPSLSKPYHHAQRNARVMKPEKQPTRRYLLLPSSSGANSLTARLLWKRPDHNRGNISGQEWPQLFSEADCQRSPCAPSWGSPGHIWDASAALVCNVFLNGSKVIRMPV